MATLNDISVKIPENDPLIVKLEKIIDRLTESLDKIEEREKVDPEEFDGSRDSDTVLVQLFDQVRNPDHKTCGKPLENYVDAWRDRVLAFGRKIVELLEKDHERKTRVLKSQLRKQGRHLSGADLDKPILPPSYGKLENAPPGSVQVVPLGFEPDSRFPAEYGPGSPKCSDPEGSIITFKDCEKRGEKFKSAIPFDQICRFCRDVASVMGINTKDLTVERAEIERRDREGQL